MMTKIIGCDIADLGNENDLYDCYVTALADSKSAELISNGQINHAQTIIRNLFSHAHKEVRIFTSSLHPDIYRDSRVVEAATTFLAKDDARIKILIQDAESLDKTSSFFNLCSEKGDSCEMRTVIAESDKLIKQHMVVMDADGYRFCADMSKNEAIASFNAPDTAKNLAQQFDVLFTRATPLLMEHALA